jgi:hypothetical protein
MLLRRQRLIRRGHIILGLLFIALLAAHLTDKITRRVGMKAA